MLQTCTEHQSNAGTYFAVVYEGYGKCPVCALIEQHEAAMQVQDDHVEALEEQVRELQLEVDHL